MCKWCYHIYQFYPEPDTYWKGSGNNSQHQPIIILAINGTWNKNCYAKNLAGLSLAATTQLATVWGLRLLHSSLLANWIYLPLVTSVLLLKERSTTTTFYIAGGLAIDKTLSMGFAGPVTKILCIYLLQNDCKNLTAYLSLAYKTVSQAMASTGERFYRQMARVACIWNAASTLSMFIYNSSHGL